MDKLTEFLIKCRLTGMVSNQIMLNIIKISINSDNLENETFNLLKNKWGFAKLNQFLLLLDKQPKVSLKAINYLDDAYPQCLRTIYNPPALLFFQERLLYLRLIASPL